MMVTQVQNETISAINNNIELEGFLLCEKCIADHKRSRKFRTCQSLFRHLCVIHPDSKDGKIKPTRLKCKRDVQHVSNLVVRGILK